MNGASLLHNINHMLNNTIDPAPVTMLELTAGKNNQKTSKNPLLRVLTTPVKKSLRILVVHDEGRVEKLLEDILFSGGHKVETAPDGSEAIKLCTNNTFDVVFINDELSGMFPWQVSEGIKKVGKQGSVILVMGWKKLPANPSGIENQFDCIISKPFSYNQVLKLVKKIAQGKL